MSLVETNRKQLETLGDYVTRANVDWFAVFPEKLAEFDQIAAANNRESHLIVYRTRTDNERDHHVIPMSLISHLFTDTCLTHSEVNQTIRWNVTLIGNLLRVAHNENTIDVTQYFGLPLPIEIDSNLTRIPRTTAADIEPPATRRIASTVYRILRDTELAKKLKQEYNFSCQICGHTIELPDGSRYAEAHHIKPLGSPHRGPDCVENLLVVCPNHHAMCDYGAIPLAIEELHVIDGHNIDRRFVAYHNNVICGTTVDA